MGQVNEATAGTLKQKLSDQIDAAKAKLDALKRELAGMHEEDMQALQKHQDEIRQRVEQEKVRARQVQANIASWKQEKVAHTQEAIRSWRQRRETDKLEARAERAEAYAADMVSVAAFDFDEAEQAVLDALAARYDAVSARTSA
jgi:regulator of replication initiation timing